MSARVTVHADSVRAMPKQPTSVPEIDPDRRPAPHKEPPPKGPRTPYPVEEPNIGDLPGTEPDYVPPTPTIPPARFMNTF